MRWKGRRGSENIEDRRRVSPKAVGVGGGLFGIIIVLVVMFMGGDPRPLLQQMQQNPPPDQPAPVEVDPQQDELARFVSVVLADTEEVWQSLFQQMGEQYQEPHLVLYRGLKTGDISQGNTFAERYSEL
jgi:hypothetical protein